MFVRFAGPRLAALTVVVCAFAAPAAAQEITVPVDSVTFAASDARSSTTNTATEKAALWAGALRADIQDPGWVIPARADIKEDRPKALVPLYATFIALQGMDIHSTRRGISSGAATEANPLMKGVAGNTGALLAVKAASTAGVIFGVEKLRKKNRVAAIALMVVINSATAYVVQHNYSVASK